jgi:hypothetical protein
LYAIHSSSSNNIQSKEDELKINKNAAGQAQQAKEAIAPGRGN